MSKGTVAMWAMREHLPTGRHDRMGNESLLLDFPYQMLELLENPITHEDTMLGHLALRFLWDSIYEMGPTALGSQTRSKRQTGGLVAEGQNLPHTG